MGYNDTEKHLLFKVALVKNMIMDYLTMQELLDTKQIVYVDKRNITKRIKPYLTIQLRAIVGKINSMVDFFAS